jgi:adenylate cyclase
VVDLMEGSLPDLRGCVAIVGTTAPGLGDVHATPLGLVFPGIEVHATVLDNILQNDFLVRPTWGSGAEAVAVVTAGLLVTLMLATTGPISCMVVIGAATLGVAFASLRLLDGPGYWVSPLAVEMVLILNAAVLSFLEYGLSRRELWIRNQQLVKSQDATISSLMALADVYDALISKRVYKDPMPHEKAAQIIVEGRGTHFDPEVVDVFLENQERFREIAARYA